MIQLCLDGTLVLARTILKAQLQSLQRALLVLKVSFVRDKSMKR